MIWKYNHTFVFVFIWGVSLPNQLQLFILGKNTLTGSAITFWIPTGLAKEEYGLDFLTDASTSETTEPITTDGDATTVVTTEGRTTEGDVTTLMTTTRDILSTNAVTTEGPEMYPDATINDITTKYTGSSSTTKEVSSTAGGTATTDELAAAVMVLHLLQVTCPHRNLNYTNRFQTLTMYNNNPNFEKRFSCMKELFKCNTVYDNHWHRSSACSLTDHLKRWQRTTHDLTSTTSPTSANHTTSTMTSTTTTDVASTTDGKLVVSEEFQKEQEVFAVISDLPAEEKKKLGYTATDFLLDCQYSGYVCGIE